MLQVTYVDHMGDDLRVCNAARISFKKKSQKLEERDKKLIKYLADHQHMSPFEHCTMTVVVECPIYIAAQIMRHRTFAYNMVSRRYTSEDIKCFEPEYRKQHESNRQASAGEHRHNAAWQRYTAEFHEKAIQIYNDMIADGVCREQARGILPQNLMTSFYMTGNLRNFQHFIDLRTHEGAQEEVRLIAGAINDILLKHFPVAMEALAHNGPEVK